MDDGEFIGSFDAARDCWIIDARQDRSLVRINPGKRALRKAAGPGLRGFCLKAVLKTQHHRIPPRRPGMMFCNTSNVIYLPPKMYRN